MHNAMVIRGRLVGPWSVELDEPVGDLTAEVEVIVRTRPRNNVGSPQNLSDFWNTLPPGNRTKEDIDRQLAEERGA